MIDHLSMHILLLSMDLCIYLMGVKDSEHLIVVVQNMYVYVSTWKTQCLLRKWRFEGEYLNGKNQFLNPHILNPHVCSICLGEYQPQDVLRSIPDCNHYFHASCIDVLYQTVTTLFMLVVLIHGYTHELVPCVGN